MSYPPGKLAQRVKNLGKYAHPPKKRDDSLGEMDINASDQLGVDQPGQSGEMGHRSDRARSAKLLDDMKPQNGLVGATAASTANPQRNSIVPAGIDETYEHEISPKTVERPLTSAGQKLKSLADKAKIRRKLEGLNK